MNFLWKLYPEKMATLHTNQQVVFNWVSSNGRADEGVQRDYFGSLVLVKVGSCFAHDFEVVPTKKTGLEQLLLQRGCRG
ncbi:hypothetical protein ACFFH4_19440 [Halalkalibacter alkalisediminis]|uniref:Uncharacterized protein n=1 Tax=Halalkalibacter alkalisediminis TaxID=935616 RepID=A0ABV6NL23_9BACI